MNVEQARQRLYTLASDLLRISERDPEQEVRGAAVPVIDAVLSEIRTLIDPADQVVLAVRDLISPEAVADGEPVRAVDALIVVNQLLHSLPPEPPRPINPTFVADLSDGGW